jgi:hypothetical protein
MLVGGSFGEAVERWVDATGCKNPNKNDQIEGTRQD